jgi:hypothetical protein
VAADDKAIAMITPRCGWWNGDLIATAPELLVVLQSLLDWGRDHLSPVHDPEAHALLVKAHQAIAKAKGETT